MVISTCWLLSNTSPKWPIVKAVGKADQHSTANFLYEEIYAQFGPPKNFLTDNGTHFGYAISLISVPWYKANITSQAHTTRRLMVGGGIQRYLGQSIEKVVDGFSQQLERPYPCDAVCLQDTYSFFSWCSPFELLYGTPANTHENDLLLQFGRRLAHERLYYLQSREPVREASQPMVVEESLPAHNKFEVGYKVLRMLHKSGGKLAAKFDTDPHLVLAVLGNGSYKLATQEGFVLRRTINGMHLTKWFERPPHYL